MKELAKIQSKLKAPKTQYNKFGGYSYRSAEDILEAVKPLLSAESCTLTITDNVEMIGSRYYIVATATIKNGKDETESATAMAREPETKKGMDESQITGSASSYARKYALNGLFAIDDNKDADMMDNAQPQVSQPQQNAVSVDDIKRWLAAVTNREQLEKAWKAVPTSQRDTVKELFTQKGQELKGGAK